MEIITSLQSDLFQYQHEKDGAPVPGTIDPIGYDPNYRLYHWIAGQVRCRVEGGCFEPRPGSLILLRPGLFYGCELCSGTPLERCLLRFDPAFVDETSRESLLAPFHSDSVPQRFVFPPSEETPFADLFHLLDRLAAQAGRGEPAAFRFVSNALLASLAEFSRTGGASAPQYAVRGDMLPILKFINENLTGDLSLDLLAQKFFISKHHLNKVFRAAAGTTVMDYIIHKRVLLARDWIAQGQSAAQAAMRAGFRDYSSFYRNYKRVLGHAPGGDKPGKI